MLKPFWRSSGLYNDDNYAKAIQCAKVTLGLLSKGNRDAVTTRSFEVPYLGGVLCAERTDEHQRLYTENVEAVFWSTPEECAGHCKQLLQNETWRAAIAKQGRARCIANGTTNQQILTKTLNRALSLRDGNMARLEVAS
jgi:spore maturation protein CgeB